MSLEASSMALWTKMMSSSMSMVSNRGFLAHVFFLAEGFCGEIFLFCGVSIGGSFSGVAFPYP
jgi:hypothetical protein